MKTFNISNENYLNAKKLKDFSNANHDETKILPNLTQLVNEVKNSSHNLRTNTNTNQNLHSQNSKLTSISENSATPGISENSVTPSLTTMMLEKQVRGNKNAKRQNNNFKKCWQSELMAIFPLSVLILLLIFVILLIFVVGFQSK